MYKRINYSKYFSMLDHMPMTTDEIYMRLQEYFPEFCDNSDVFLEILISLHAPLYRSGNNVVNHTLHNINIDDSILCFVDIETTSANIDEGQIIEIGAVKTQNCKIIDTFSTLVHSYYVPENIEYLTGIDVTMLENSPKLSCVLEQFAQFLGDSVFIAHNVKFDYDFISHSLVGIGLPPLLNARLCTVDLSRRAIISKKYGLPYLNNLLGINNNTIHRALADAITSFELYKICSFAFPHNVKTIKDLIDFSKGKIKYAKKLR